MARASNLLESWAGPRAFEQTVDSGLRLRGLPMSLRSMLQVEFDRDSKSSPKKRIRKKTGAKTSESVEERQKSSDLLVHAIPTEVLAPYTALVAGIVATIDPGENAQAGLRWSIYAAGFVAIALGLGIPYMRQRATTAKRKFPVAGTLTAMLAFGAWGSLAMSHCPMQSLGRPAAPLPRIPARRETNQTRRGDFARLAGYPRGTSQQTPVRAAKETLNSRFTWQASCRGSQSQSGRMHPVHEEWQWEMTSEVRRIAAMWAREAARFQGTLVSDRIDLRRKV